MYSIQNGQNPLPATYIKTYQYQLTKLQKWLGRSEEILRSWVLLSFSENGKLTHDQLQDSACICEDNVQS